MPEPTLEAAVEEARALLRGQRIPCSYPHSELTPQSHRAICVDRMVPDPAYTPLLALFEEPCACSNCRGLTTPNLLHWMDEPNGALEGALMKATTEFLDDHYFYDKTLHLHHILTNLLQNDGDTKLAAVQALVEWLKKERP